MAEIHLAPFSHGVGLGRLFQTSNPSRLGSISIVLDGSISTDRDVNTGSVWIEVKDPVYAQTCVGQINADPNVDPCVNVDDDVIATAFITQGLERLSSTSKL